MSGAAAGAPTLPGGEGHESRRTTSALLASAYDVADFSDVLKPFQRPTKRGRGRSRKLCRFFSTKLATKDRDTLIYESFRTFVFAIIFTLISSDKGEDYGKDKGRSKIMISFRTGPNQISSEKGEPPK